jgi:hypothetical protein
MSGNNWDLDGPVARHIECYNVDAAIGLMSAIVVYALAKAPREPPGEGVLKGLHQVLTFLLLERPGQYRDSATCIFAKDLDTGLTTIARQAPPPSDIDVLMAEFFHDLAAMWPIADPLDVASFALWKVCWVHPFKNGNGRAARAFAFTCLCVKLGRLLPGAQTFLDQNVWPEYYASIREGHATFAAGALDLSRLKAYLATVLKVQAHVVKTSRSATGAPLEVA